MSSSVPPVFASPVSFISSASSVTAASKCAACGRQLTDEVSIAVGLGPECREKHGYNRDLGSCDSPRGDEAAGIIHEIACDSSATRRNLEQHCRRLESLGFLDLSRRIRRRFRMDQWRAAPTPFPVKSPAALAVVATSPQLAPAPTITTPRAPNINGTDAEHKIAGAVKKYHFKSAKWSAGTFERAFSCEDDFTGNSRDLRNYMRTLSFAGPVCADLDTQVVLHGSWIDDHKYGRQFKVDLFEIDQQLDAAGLAHYLANNPAMKGIGPARAKLIAQSFGANFTDVLHDTPELIAEAAGMPLANVLAMREEWDRNASINVTATKLAAYELTHHQITTLIEKFGNNAAVIVENDPYLMLGCVDGMGFSRIDDIARKTKISKTHPGRINAGIVYTVERAASLQGDGSTWVEWQELVACATEILTLDEMNARDIVDTALTEIIRHDEDPRLDDKHKRLVCVSSNNRLLVAVPWLYKAELRVAAALRHGTNSNPHASRLVADDEACEGLTEGQCAAVNYAADKSIVLIAGGAGVGKTHVIKRIVEMYEAANLTVELCAPTGKAAKRMEQVVKRRAQTIHRLLRCQGSGDNAWPEMVVQADVVIVDEMSMVSSHIAWRLFKSIDLTRTAVVLVGDHNQLPPVEAGNPLRDLTERRCIPTVMLDEVVRQVGPLKVNSLAILEGRVEPTAAKAPIIHGVERSPWIIINHQDTPEVLAAAVVELFDKHIERLGFDLMRDVQLLTPTHKGPVGDDALNVALQRMMQRKLWKFDVPEPRSKRAYDFHAHDRVIHIKNNYELGVMNGEIGTVTRTDAYTGEVFVYYPDLRTGRGEEDGVAIYTNKLCPECEGRGKSGKRDKRGFEDSREACVKCDGRVRAPLREIQLAYALTIHKYQGSEIGCAVIICSKAHSFQHHRNLLYTGVTRARETAIIIGDPWAMRNCASKSKLDERNTFLRTIDFVSAGNSTNSTGENQ